MAEEIYIKKIEDIIGVVLDQKYDVRIDRHRSSFLYRGLPNDSFTLTTSIELQRKVDGFRKTYSEKLYKICCDAYAGSKGFGMEAVDHRTASRFTYPFIRLDVFTFDCDAFCDKWRTPS